MTLQMIQEKYIGKRLNLYLIDGEDVTLDKTGTLTFRFQAEIFGDEALEVTNSLCEARLTLGDDQRIMDEGLNTRIGSIGGMLFGNVECHAQPEYRLHKQPFTFGKIAIQCENKIQLLLK